MKRNADMPLQARSNDSGATTRTCQRCGASFTPKRLTTGKTAPRYCSTSCRVRAWERRRLLALLDKAGIARSPALAQALVNSTKTVGPVNTSAPKTGD